MLLGLEPKSNDEPQQHGNRPREFRIGRARSAERSDHRGLAHFQRTPHVVAIQPDQVESVEEDTVVVAVVTDEIERGNAVVAFGSAPTCNGTVLMVIREKSQFRAQHDLLSLSPRS